MKLSWFQACREDRSSSLTPVQRGERDFVSNEPG